ncbi:MAG TPA: FHA domain-containing protein [Pseudomonadales bacterium]|nr:FHA domain-containing protein [Pseudomonadales bacterium]
MAGLQEKTIIRSEPTEARPVARIQFDNGITFAVNEVTLPITFGRSNECDICIPSGHVSRRHCELYLVNGVLCLKDTSSNGTVIDNRVVKQESVSIRNPTSVLFAGEVNIKIIPTSAEDPLNEERRREQRRNDERRRNDRRECDRRKSAVVVNFERRESDDRRTGDRRT